MSPYARLVESLLESKASRRARKRANQGKPTSPQPAVGAEQEKVQPTPTTPTFKVRPTGLKPVKRKSAVEKIRAKLKAQDAQDRERTQQGQATSKETDSVLKKADQTVDKTLGGRKLV